MGNAHLNADRLVLEDEVVYPRDEEHRYRIYLLTGGELRVAAFAPDPAGVGVAICRMHADQREQGRRLPDLGAIGVLDTLDSQWIILPWQRPQVPVTFGPMVEQVRVVQ